MLERRAHGLELGLRQDLDLLGAAEPVGAKLDLGDRLLAGDEERTPAARDDVAERSQQQRRLADTRLPADEHERGRHETAAEHPVELGHACADPRRLLDTDIGQPLRGARAMPPSPLRRRALPDSSSTSVPNAPHPGHLPSQRPVVVPHSEQTCWTITFAISRWYATTSDGPFARSGNRDRVSPAA